MGGESEHFLGIDETSFMPYTLLKSGNPVGDIGGKDLKEPQEKARQIQGRVIQQRKADARAVKQD